MAEKFPVAATLKLRNGYLFRLLQARQWTQHDLAQYLGVTDNAVSNWMRFVQKPTDPTICRMLMELTGIAIDDLFPARLYSKAAVIPTDVTVVNDIAVSQLVGRVRLQLPSAPSPEGHAAITQRSVLINKALNMLDSREQDILTRRFGFNGPEEYLEDIGRSLGINRERVRQIEAHALRKLKWHGQFGLLQELR